MKYYAMIEGTRKGPYTLDELAQAGVTPSTYVWTKGMKDWEKAEDVADICRYFRQRIAALQHPGTVEMPAKPSIPEPEEQQAPDDGLTDEERQRLDEIPQAFRRMVYKSGKIPTTPPRQETEDINSEPQSYLVWAVLATILCCPLVGFVAIYFSFRTRTLWRQATQTSEASEATELKTQAHDASRKARMWTGITVCLGIMLFGFFLGGAMRG